jgi:hypothetical protein
VKILTFLDCLWQGKEDLMKESLLLQYWLVAKVTRVFALFKNDFH